MTEVRFYHLQRDTAERAVPDLIGKALSRDLRVVLKLPDENRRQFYDDWLWKYQADSMLPHAQEGDPMPEAHPVWLTTKDEAPNNATMALAVEGAALPPLNKFKMICLLFDSHDEARLQEVRQLWAELKKQDGLQLAYWQQQPDGRWVQQNT